MTHSGLVASKSGTSGSGTNRVHIRFLLRHMSHARGIFLFDGGWSLSPDRLVDMAVAVKEVIGYSNGKDLL